MNKKAMRYQNKQPLSTDTDNEAVAKRHKNGKTYLYKLINPEIK